MARVRLEGEAPWWQAKVDPVVAVAPLAVEAAADAGATVVVAAVAALTYPAQLLHEALLQRQLLRYKVVEARGSCQQYHLQRHTGKSHGVEEVPQRADALADALLLLLLLLLLTPDC